MKIIFMRIITFIVFLFPVLVLAQVTKSIHLTTAGTLSTMLTTTEKASITNLTVTGSIDARDIKCIRDELLGLLDIDLKNTTVAEYIGTGGTHASINQYNANVIPYGAFHYKRMIQSIILPKNVREIDSFMGEASAFGYCGRLKNVILPDSLKKLGRFAFDMCTELESITLPKGLTVIDEYVFFGNSKMKDVIIPETVTTIYNNSFVSCNAKLYVDSENPIFSSLDGVLFNKDQTRLIKCNTWITGDYTVPTTVNYISEFAFDACYNLRGVHLSNSVKVIDNEAFFHSGITSVNIPKSVTKIGAAAFKTCASLKYIYMENNNPAVLTDSIFDGFISADNPTFRGRVDKKSCVLIVPIGSKSTYKSAFEWGSFSSISEISLGNDILNGNINPGTLAGLSKVVNTSEIKKIILSGDIDIRDLNALNTDFLSTKEIDLTNCEVVYGNNSLPYGSFLKHPNLNVLKLPKNLTAIDNMSIFMCDSLTDVIVGNKLETIKWEAFKKCKGLTSILIPASVTLLDPSAFNECSKLTHINIDNNNEYYSSIDGIVYNKDKSKLVIVPNGKEGEFNVPANTKAIGEVAFLNCAKITKINLNEGLETIEYDAFDYCTGLTKLFLPKTITEIQDFMFIGCENLDSLFVDISNVNYSSQNGVLFNKDFSTLLHLPVTRSGKYRIPSIVSSIGEYSFLNCDKLNELTIPLNVKSIESCAFWNLKGLSALYLEHSIPIDISSKDRVFANINPECVLYVPKGSKVSYQSANQWKDFSKIVEFTTAIQISTVSKLKTYPNPATDFLYISGQKENMKIEILSITGKHIKSYNLNQGFNSIDVSALPKGIYLINGLDKGEKWIGKFVKE